MSENSNMCHVSLEACEGDNTKSFGVGDVKKTMKFVAIWKILCWYFTQSSIWGMLDWSVSVGSLPEEFMVGGMLDGVLHRPFFLKKNTNIQTSCCNKGFKSRLNDFLFYDFLPFVQRSKPTWLVIFIPGEYFEYERMYDIAQSALGNLHIRPYFVCAMVNNRRGNYSCLMFPFCFCLILHIARSIDLRRFYLFWRLDVLITKVSWYECKIWVKW